MYKSMLWSGFISSLQLVYLLRQVAEAECDGRITSRSGHGDHSGQLVPLCQLSYEFNYGSLCSPIEV